MNPMDLVKSILPWVGTTLLGPVGGIAATFVGSKLGLSDKSIEAVKTALSGMSAEELAKYKDLDNQFQTQMQKMGYEHLETLAEIEYKTDALAVEVIKSVNATMQTEAASEKWPSYSWRPFIGFSFGFYILSLWILPMYGKVPVTLTPDMTITVGAILGVASWFRGKAQNNPEIQNTPTVTQKG